MRIPMKIVLFLFAILLAMPVVANAQDSTKRLVVWLANGQKVYHDLSDDPETSFSDGRLWLETNKVSVSYPLTDVLRYTYEGFIATGIEQQPNESAVAVSKDGFTVTFHHLKSEVPVCLYAPNGTLLEQHKCDGDTPLTLSVKNRPRGVYIVKCGSQTIKLMRP